MKTCVYWLLGSCVELMLFYRVHAVSIVSLRPAAHANVQLAKSIRLLISCRVVFDVL